MNYIVWTKEYEGVYKKVDCGDKGAAEREIFEALKQGKEPMLTVQVPYSCNVKMGEIKDVEPSPTKPVKPLPPDTKPEEGKDEAGKDKAKQD